MLLVEDTYVSCIPNESLQSEQIPKPNASWEELSRFALTCNGYEEAGSFNECARIAKPERTQIFQSSVYAFSLSSGVGTILVNILMRML